MKTAGLLFVLWGCFHVGWLGSSGAGQAPRGWLSRPPTFGPEGNRSWGNPTSRQKERKPAMRPRACSCSGLVGGSAKVEDWGKEEHQEPAWDHSITNEPQTWKSKDWKDSAVRVSRQTLAVVPFLLGLRKGLSHLLASAS